MPIVEVHLIEGYSADAKTRLGTALTEAVQRVLPAPPEAITILTHEVPPANYMRGGTARIPAPALPDAEGIVRAFLAALEARDLEAAQSHLAPGATLHFPGAKPFTKLEELVTWAKPRYRFVTKTYAGFDTAQSGAETVLYCHGTLSGAWPNGTAFEGIRFIDRFTLKAGQITRQDVWNDIAEVRPHP